MTIIDTTTYCNGELRLAKHGAGKGGTVLTHVPSGEQATILEDYVDSVVDALERGNAQRYPSDALFHDLRVYDPTQTAD